MIDSWLVLPEADRLPVTERGTNGRSHAFRLSGAYAWRQARDASEAAERRLAEDAAGQLRLALLGGSVEDRSRAMLSPREQAEALRVENEWIVAARNRRDLIRASDVAEAFEKSFANIRDSLDAAPDRLARELNLGGAEVEIIQDILDDVLRSTAASLEASLSD